MTIAEGLIAFLWTFTDENGNSINDIFMDIVQGNPYALAVSPSSENVIKRYLNGDEVKEANFQIYLNAYTQENYDRVQNTQFVDKMKEWINRQSKRNVFPEIGENRTCRKIEASNAMIYDTNQNGEGLYLLQVKITYYEKWIKEKEDEKL